MSKEEILNGLQALYDLLNNDEELDAELMRLSNTDSYPTSYLEFAIKELKNRN